LEPEDVDNQVELACAAHGAGQHRDYEAKEQRYASVNEGEKLHAKRKKSLWRIGQKISRCMRPLL